MSHPPQRAGLAPVRSTQISPRARVRLPPPPPFVWLVTTVFPQEGPIGPPPSLALAAGRAIVEPSDRPTGSVWTREGEEGRFPKAYRDRVLTTWVGPDRGALFDDGPRDDDAFFTALDGVCAGLDPLLVGKGVEHDSPRTRLTLRDGAAWLNGPRSWPPCLPDLGTFYNDHPPDPLVARLGPTWPSYAFGLVCIELASTSRHSLLAALARLTDDLAAADRWRHGDAPTAPILWHPSEKDPS